MARKWVVEFHSAFYREFQSMNTEQSTALLAAAKALSIVGPTGGRPLIGTLSNPKHPNMKELRYDAANGAEVWRAAFAFDPRSIAMLLAAGDKQGVKEEQFYKSLLSKANKRFDNHLKALTEAAAENRRPTVPQQTGGKKRRT